MTVEMITAIGALIAGLASIVNAIVMNRKTTALMQYRLEQVEKKLDSHNGYAKMFSESADRIAKIETDIAVIKTALEFIQKEVKS